MRLPLAVLIDGENISDRLFAPLKELVEVVGVPVNWQLFGDFFTWPHPGWQEVATAEGIEIRHQFNGGKNASDIAMTVAAMDLLQRGKVRGICLVSSDSDFAALARRLKADSMAVFGFGEDKTPASFRDACTAFTVLGRPLAVVPAGTGLDQLDIKRLHELLNTVCRERGQNGRIHISVAAKYVQDTAPDLYPRIGKGFLVAMRKLSFVQVHDTGSQSLLSVRHSPLALVR